MKKHPLTLVLSATLLAGCVSMAPTYQRPESPVAAHWRDGATTASTQDTIAVADLAWKDLFADARLRQVIAMALDNNRDLRVAVLNIEKARAEYRIQNADLLPSVSASGTGSASRTPSSVNGTGKATVSHEYSASVGFSSYELDLFGRVRSLSNEALETYLATTETQRGTRLSLVAEVAGDWLTLAADVRRLSLAEQTLASQRETLKLTEYQHAEGIVSGVDLAQVQSSVESARADVGSYTAQVKQDRDALDLVVGASVPTSLLPRGDETAPVALAGIPAGLDSGVLLARPDVISAEHTLKAANADIGAARAAFFPTISLTASAGRSSDQLDGLFGSDNRSWSFSPTISVPIFNAGSLKASLKVSKVERDIAVADYEKAIQTAFSEVADALAVRSTLDERLDAQRSLVMASLRGYQLADARYRSGVDTYLSTLDAQRTLYSAQQNLISLELVEQSNRVTLYKVLGGGADAQSSDLIASATGDDAAR